MTTQIFSYDNDVDAYFDFCKNYGIDRDEFENKLTCVIDKMVDENQKFDDEILQNVSFTTVEIAEQNEVNQEIKPKTKTEIKTNIKPKTKTEIKTKTKTEIKTQHKNEYLNEFELKEFYKIKMQAFVCGNIFSKIMPVYAMFNFATYNLFRFGDGDIYSTLKQQLTTKNIDLNINVRNGIVASSQWLDSNALDTSILENLELLFSKKNNFTIKEYMKFINVENDIDVIKQLFFFIYNNHQYYIEEFNSITTYRHIYKIKTTKDLINRRKDLLNGGNFKFCLEHCLNLTILKRDIKKAHKMDLEEERDYNIMINAIGEKKIAITTVDYNKNISKTLDIKPVNIYKIINYQHRCGLFDLIFQTNACGILTSISKNISKAQKRKIDEEISDSNKKIKL